MRRRSIAITRPAQAVAAGLLMAGSAVVWLAAMGPRLWAEAVNGPICSGHGALLAAHCPPCYAAAALLAAGLVAIVSNPGAGQ